jgi:hypothetical protein
VRVIARVTAPLLRTARGRRYLTLAERDADPSSGIRRESRGAPLAASGAPDYCGWMELEAGGTGAATPSVSCETCAVLRGARRLLFCARQNRRPVAKGRRAMSSAASACARPVPSAGRDHGRSWRVNEGRRLWTCRAERSWRLRAGGSAGQFASICARPMRAPDTSGPQHRGRARNSAGLLPRPGVTPVSPSTRAQEGPEASWVLPCGYGFTTGRGDCGGAGRLNRSGVRPGPRPPRA